MQLHAFFFIMNVSLGAGETNKILNIMYTLNFPNGSSQTYPDFGTMSNAAKLLGGEAKQVNGKIYAFVPKK